jgi:hypothetical protein
VSTVHPSGVDKTGMTEGLIYSILMIYCIHVHLLFFLSNTPGNINFEKVDKTGYKMTLEIVKSHEFSRVLLLG